MSLVVLCAGGHARVIIEALRSRHQVVDAVTDQAESLVGQCVADVPVIGNDDLVERMKPETAELVNGLGNRATRDDSGLAARRWLFERFSGKGFRFPAVVHASAIVASDAVIGDGAQILAGAIIQPAARVGANAIVNTGAIVEHDCEVGAHAHIAPGAILCGGVTVGEEAHIGAGAVVLQTIEIGSRAMIAAGSVVARNVAEGQFFGPSGRGAAGV